MHPNFGTTSPKAAQSTLATSNMSTVPLSTYICPVHSYPQQFSSQIQQMGTSQQPHDHHSSHGPVFQPYPPFNSGPTYLYHLDATGQPSQFSGQPSVPNLHAEFQPYPDTWQNYCYCHLGGPIGHLGNPLVSESHSAVPLKLAAMGPMPLPRTTNFSPPQQITRETESIQLAAGTRVTACKAIKAMSRSPPKRPKHAGHALWVGNLPSRATILDLKDFFSRGFTDDIESLFLIAKSNCAFVNYRTEDACTRAIQTFHNTRFQSIQIVCRLRKTAAHELSPIERSASTANDLSSPLSPSIASNAKEEDDNGEQMADVCTAVDAEEESGPPEDVKASERYFVIKSLTMQDMVNSVRKGTWSTQKHNEEVLNNAFTLADNVYLIFSANRSREYFGYARLASLIPPGVPNSNDGTDVQRVKSSEVIEIRKTPTSCTENAPAGRIVEDLFRGTILWEAVRSEDEEADVDIAEDEMEAWGKDFKVEWVSTKRVPFYRARGLRNRWNANKEVKIARDGTEIEPDVGAKLVQLFHRANNPAHSPGPLANFGQRMQIQQYQPPRPGPTGFPVHHLYAYRSGQ